MPWEPSGAEATRQERKQSRTRSIEDLWDDVEDALPKLSKIVLKFRFGPRAGRYRNHRNTYLVSDDNRDAAVIIEDITEQAEQIEERHGHCTFQTTCEVDVGGETKSYPPLVWELYENGGAGNEVQSEALQLIRQQSRILRHQGSALSRQVGDVERASNAVVNMIEATAKSEGASVEAIRARLEHARWEAENKTAEEMSKQELDLIQDLGPKALALMAASEARKAATAAKGGDRSALWKNAIEIAKAVRGRAAVQDVLGAKGTEIIDSLGAAACTLGGGFQFKFLI